MSAKPLEEEPAYFAMDGESSGRLERRTRGRIRVHWPIWFYQQGAQEAAQTVTSDLSSRGFHFLTSLPLVPGEFTKCTLGVPANDPWSIDQVLLMECKIQIVRVQSHGDGLYGVGCRIQDYRVVDTSNPKNHYLLNAGEGSAAGRILGEWDGDHGGARS
jgi:hypothetical protein